MNDFYDPVPDDPLTIEAELAQTEETPLRGESLKELKLQALKKQHQMAISRTQLSIDCVWLSNWRTLIVECGFAVTLLVAGVTITRYFGDGWHMIIGYSLNIVSPIAFAIGVWRFRYFHKKSVMKQTRDLEEMHWL